MLIYPWKTIIFIIVIVLLFLSLIGKPKEKTIYEIERESAIKLSGQVNGTTIEGFEGFNYPYDTRNNYIPPYELNHPVTSVRPYLHNNVPVIPYLHEPVSSQISDLPQISIDTNAPAFTSNQRFERWGTPSLTHTHKTTHTHQPLHLSYRPKRHAKLNYLGGIEYVDIKPPCARGEYSCTPVTCPSVFDKGIVCWTCNDIIVEPQNYL